MKEIVPILELIQKADTLLQSRTCWPRLATDLRQNLAKSGRNNGTSQGRQRRQESQEAQESKKNETHCRVPLKKANFR